MIVFVKEGDRIKTILLLENKIIAQY